MADKWQQESSKIDGGTGRTEPRPRTKVVQESYNKIFSVVVRESTLKDIDDIAQAGGYKSRNALINEILEAYIDNYFEKKGK